MGLGKVIGALGKALNNRRDHIAEEIMIDPTGWMVNNSISQFLLLSTKEIKYMCMLAYAFMAGRWILYSFLSDSFAKTSFLLLTFIYCILYFIQHNAANKVFSTVSPTASASYKFASCILATTGGGILVPIFFNGIPVPLAQDAYVIAIVSAYCLHHYFPILRDILNLSPYFKVRNEK